MVFFLVPAVAFVVGVRPQAFENRRLAAFPSPAAGWGFFTGLPNWATDHLPLRQAGVRAETGLSEGLFGEPPAFSSTDRQPASGAGPIGPIGVPPQQQENSGSTADFSQVVQGTDGWIYFAQDMSAKCRPNRPLTTTIAALRQLRADVESSGRSFVLVVAPDKSTVAPEHLPASYPDQACAQAAAGPFWSAVTTQAGALDLRAGLRALTGPGRTPIYYPQDTHWTDLGSLEMLRSVADTIQPGVSIGWRSAPDGLVSRPADLPPIIGQTGLDIGAHYALRPDGTHDRVGRSHEDLSGPTHFGGAPLPGMINQPVTLLGDSFLERGTPYLPAVFSDATAVAYATLLSDPARVTTALTSSRVVVVEIVERDLATGSAQILQPGALDTIGSVLASHPVH